MSSNGNQSSNTNGTSSNQSSAAQGSQSNGVVTSNIPEDLRNLLESRDYRAAAEWVSENGDKTTDAMVAEIKQNPEQLRRLREQLAELKIELIQEMGS
ncbi:hypothetical protein G7046_g3675 [Stylonectria norvegica]|nr:hypothetical protein G7046_g3675 [Stylonectria norvegica]